MIRHARTGAGLALAIIVPLVAATARAEQPRGNPFACYGAAEGIVRNMSADQIAREVDKRITDVAPDEEGGFDRAVRLCTTAELARRVGDYRAEELYEQAIAAAPDEPGFELWYASYLRGVRGPHAPLLERAEVHYDRALQKLAAVRAAGATRDFDAITEDWIQRGMLTLYQEDGLPLLPKAYPFEPGDGSRVGAFVTLIERASMDTADFDTVDDTRRFTSELLFAQSRQRLGTTVNNEDRARMVRTPLRWQSLARLRLRLPSIGAFDVGYDVVRAYNSQITRFTEPTNFGDVEVNTLAVGFNRSIAVGKLFDLMIDGGYRYIDRKGVVEWEPERREGIHMIEAHPVIARFIGPDKVTLGSNVVYMDIPPQPFPSYDRERRRLIKAFYGDYSLYRPLLLPGKGGLRRRWTRGVSLFGGYAMDDEVYGIRVVHRRDTWGGITFRGPGTMLPAWLPDEVTLQGTMFTGYTTYRERDANNNQNDFVDPEQSNAQFRPTMLLLYRLVDEDTTPGMPSNPFAGLNLVIPVRHDFAVDGTNTFENTRAGAELWAKLIFRSMRGSTVLVTAGYDVEVFHRLDKIVHMGHVALRLGWGQL